MNAAGSGAGRLVGSLVSAAIGALSLLICLAVIVLNSDGGAGSRTVLPAGGGDRAPEYPGSAPRASTSEAGPDIAACTETECPALGPPTAPPGTFPFPPGAAPAKWGSGVCDDYLGPKEQVRQVRMSLTQARAWYLNNLLAAGYGWGQYGPLHANPFTKDDAGNDVVLGWDGNLTTNDPARSGQLSIEHSLDGRELCGPDVGFVFIRADLP